MNRDPLTHAASAYLHTLCNDIFSRALGSSGNRAATDWFADTVAAFGFAVEKPSFACMDWSSSGASLAASNIVYPAHSSPYSLGCDVRAPLVVVNTVAELESADITDKIVLLYGDIAREQLMPQNFAFYNPVEHQHIYQLLNSKRPAAIITATGRNPSVAGALYPFPMLEDGDFDVPSVYLTDKQGTSIAGHVGETVHLVSCAERRLAGASNVIARRAGMGSGRIVLMAHIDTKAGTPGALDNAGGIVTLLLLAELLSDYTGRHTIEIVALNGEDYYSNPGEMEYMRRNRGAFDTIALAVNVDGVGYHKGKTAWSLYGCPPALTQALDAGLSVYSGLCEGEPWYQGDHMMMVMHERPTLAFTSEQAMELLTTVIHTERDTPALVDPARLIEIAFALREVVWRVNMLER
ncbi:MAG: M28 family peptidase [Chloroflexota bacterium]|nr:M28 family peptidase [Chloroflexota bacterium]